MMKALLLIIAVLGAVVAMLFGLSAVLWMIEGNGLRQSLSIWVAAAGAGATTGGLGGLIILSRPEQ
jgi:hypothetical protein